MLAELERLESAHTGGAHLEIKMIDSTSISSGVNNISATPQIDGATVQDVIKEKSSSSKNAAASKPQQQQPQTDEKNTKCKRRRSQIERTTSMIRRSLRSHPSSVISAKDMRTAFMLFVVSFLYVVFYLPSIISTYLALLFTNIQPNLYLSYLFFSNSAINPLIYCFLNPNFRADLFKLFFKRGFIYDRCVKNTK
jgi:hypothetical protein